MAFIDRLTDADSPDFIKLETIKSWARIEHNLDDDLLNNLRMVAVTMAFNYTQNDFNEETDTGELVEKPIPFNVVLACMMIITFLYENRGEVMFDYGSGTPLPITSLQLLNPYKRLVGT
jgi:hypothetical protein